MGPNVQILFDGPVRGKHAKWMPLLNHSPEPSYSAAPWWITVGVTLVAARLLGLPAPAAGGVALAGFGAMQELAAVLRSRRASAPTTSALLALQGVLYAALAAFCFAADFNATPGWLAMHALSLSVCAAVVWLAARMFKHELA